MASNAPHDRRKTTSTGFCKRLEVQLPPDNGIDLDVEGLVDRINGISRRIKRGMEATLADFDLTLGRLAHAARAPPRSTSYRSSPGVLAADLEVSSGAMTSRLDRLEIRGLDPAARRQRGPARGRRRADRGGRTAWDTAAGVQGRREAFFASALTKPEQRQLNDLLRKLMLAFENETDAPDCALTRRTRFGRACRAG